MRNRAVAGASVVMVLLLTHCGVGEIIDTGDAGCPYECPEGLVCVDRNCIDPGEGCEGVECPPGTTCVAGDCIDDEDPCDGMQCDPGFTCQAGACVSDEIDNDLDGYRAAEDCDDGDATINPGAAEVCDGVDQNCNDEVDEGFDNDLDGSTTCGGDCNDSDENVHPGAEERCNDIDDDCDGDIDEDIASRPCSTACGDGDESCVDGVWECDAVETCECTSGEEDRRDCGRCGTEVRTCSSGSWSSWSSCTGEGVCPPGDVENQDCGRCGTQTRTCTDTCNWGTWSSCTDEGVCSPGETDGSVCDACSQRTCSDYCLWGPCMVRPENECEWRSGTHFRCCGDGRWQYCLSSCMWSTACESCLSTSCPSCH